MLHKGKSVVIHDFSEKCLVIFLTNINVQEMALIVTNKSIEIDICIEMQSIY